MQSPQPILLQLLFVLVVLSLVFTAAKIAWAEAPFISLLAGGAVIFFVLKDRR
jgi:hypothetical protein